jgi:hypothetical protein
MKYIQDVLLFYRQKIESAQKPSGHVNKPITVPLGGSGKMYGIVSVPEHCLRCKYTQIYNRVCEGKSYVRYFFFQVLNFLVESFGLLNDLFPLPMILDTGYPVFCLHLADVLFYVILPSVLGSSL